MTTVIKQFSFTTFASKPKYPFIVCQSSDNKCIVYYEPGAKVFPYSIQNVNGLSSTSGNMLSSTNYTFPFDGNQHTLIFANISNTIYVGIDVTPTTTSYLGNLGAFASYGSIIQNATFSFPSINLNNNITYTTNGVKYDSDANATTISICTDNLTVGQIIFTSLDGNIIGYYKGMVITTTVANTNYYSIQIAILDSSTSNQSYSTTMFNGITPSGTGQYTDGKNHTIYIQQNVNTNFTSQVDNSSSGYNINPNIYNTVPIKILFQLNSLALANPNYQTVSYQPMYNSITLANRIQALINSSSSSSTVDISGLQTSLTNLQTKASSDISGLQTSLTSLQTKESSDISGLQTSLTNLQTNFNNILTKLNAIQTQLSISNTMQPIDSTEDNDIKFLRSIDDIPVWETLNAVNPSTFNSAIVTINNNISNVMVKPSTFLMKDINNNYAQIDNKVIYFVYKSNCLVNNESGNYIYYDGTHFVESSTPVTVTSNLVDRKKYMLTFPNNITVTLNIVGISPF